MADREAETTIETQAGTAAEQEPLGTAPKRAGVPRRLLGLLFGLAFQLFTFIAVFIVANILRGHYQGSTYSGTQQLIAAVLGIPGVILAIGSLIAAIYTCAAGRRAALTYKLALASIVVLLAAFGLELAFK